MCVIVLWMKCLWVVGSTVMVMFGHFLKFLWERGLYFVVCGIEGELE